MGNDTVHGLGGDDWAVGGKDNDLLYGDAGADIVYGNLGNDTCYGGDGADSIDGGVGIDTLDYSGSTSGVSIAIDGSTGHGGQAEGDVALNVEHLVGSDYADTLGGSADNDTIEGGGGKTASAKWRETLEADLKDTKGLTVSAEIVAQAKGEKVIVFKKRRRHNYRRRNGHRQQLTLLRILARHGYDYDCSTFPTFVGPLARAYYFMSARKLSEQESDERQDLFGSVRDGLRPLSGYLWALSERDEQGRLRPDLLEIPVTTLPVLRTPIHMSYLLFLAQRSPWLMRRYLDTAMTMCKLRGVEPSFLLHPLDFISGEECPALRFFPAMNMPATQKQALLKEVLGKLSDNFRVVPMNQHAEALRRRGLPHRQPDLAG